MLLCLKRSVPKAGVACNRRVLLPLGVCIRPPVWAAKMSLNERSYRENGYTHAPERGLGLIKRLPEFNNEAWFLTSCSAFSLLREACWLRPCVGRGHISPGLIVSLRSSCYHCSTESIRFLRGKLLTLCEKCP